MAVIPHAQTRSTPGNYNTLTATHQDHFDALMDQADTAGPHGYAPLMSQIALLTGINAHDIRKCGCSCWCPAIFDAEDPDAHVIEQTGGYNLGRIQCPWCADQHRETA